MASKMLADCISENFLAEWAQMFARLRKPIIAAVNGFAVHQPQCAQQLISRISHSLVEDVNWR